MQKNILTPGIRLFLALAAITFGIIISLSYQPTFGQIPVGDQMLKDTLAQQAAQNTEQWLVLEFIAHFSKQTRDTAAATYQLQQDYQSFLKQTTSTRDLRFSELTKEAELSQQVQQASSHLQDYSFASQLFTVYHAQLDPMEKSQSLFSGFIADDGSMLFNNFADFQNYQISRKQQLAALEEMSQQRKLEMASTLQQVSQQYIDRVAQMQKLLAKDETFSMTHAERLHLMQRCEKYLQRSRDFKYRADQLIQSAQSSPTLKSGVIQSFKHYQQQKLLAQSLTCLFH